MNNNNESIDSKNILTNKVTVIVVLVLAFISFVMTGPFSGGNTSTPNKVAQTEGVTNNQVYIVSKTFVEDALISPSSAKFSADDYAIQNKGSNTYRINSYVDSENAFGASIRSNYSALLMYKGGDWVVMNNWELKELIIDDVVVYETE